MSSKALITGITGYIGSHLARKLVAEGWTVVGIMEPNWPDDLVRDMRGQLSLHVHDGSTESLLRIAADVKPDVCFHLASQFLASHRPENIVRLIQSNVTYGTQLAEALVAADAPLLVNVGTSWQHFESNSYNPVALYSATKQAFQDILKYYTENSCLRVLTLKFFDTYGPSDPRAKVLNIIHRAALEGKELEMTGGEQWIDLVYIDDIVSALMRAFDLLRSDSTKDSAFAVSSGRPVQLRELAAIYSSVTGIEPKIRWGMRPYRPREMFTPWSAGPVISGWTPQINLEEGISRMTALSK